MSRKGLLAVLLFATTVSTTLIAEDGYDVIPVNVSLVPLFGLGQPAGHKTVNNLQLNVVAGYSDVLRGAAFGVVSIIGEDAAGIQAGVLNWVGDDLTGLQAGVLNYAKRSSLAQAGVVNVSKRARGVQLGVVNIAGENDGVPIGLISIVGKGGQTHAQAWYDELGLANVALIHGTRTVYNIYTAGVDSRLEDLTVGLGLGVHIPLDRLFLNVEGIAGSVSPVNAIIEEHENLFRARVYLGYAFSSFALIGGVSFNSMSAGHDTGITLDPVHGYEFGFSSDRRRFWPGAFIGVQF